MCPPHADDATGGTSSDRHLVRSMPAGEPDQPAVVAVELTLCDTAVTPPVSDHVVGVSEVINGQRHSLPGWSEIQDQRDQLEALVLPASNRDQPFDPGNSRPDQARACRILVETVWSLLRSFEAEAPRISRDRLPLHETAENLLRATPAESSEDPSNRANRGFEGARIHEGIVFQEHNPPIRAHNSWWLRTARSVCCRGRESKYGGECSEECSDDKGRTPARFHIHHYTVAESMVPMMRLP